MEKEVRVKVIHSPWAALEVEKALGQKAGYLLHFSSSKCSANASGKVTPMALADPMQADHWRVGVRGTSAGLKEWPGPLTNALHRAGCRSPTRLADTAAANHSRKSPS